MERGKLEALAREQGARVFGVADLVALRARMPDLTVRVPGNFIRGVVMGVRLQQAVLEAIDQEPTPLYCHHYRQVNYQLDTLALRVADELQADGWSAVAVPASQIIQREPMQGHVSHKLLAWAAGVGHIGRNNLLVHPAFGAQVRYVSVLTDCPLEPGQPRPADCGACRACIDRCPAGAIGETAKDFNLDACYGKLGDFTRLSYIGQHICGVCVKACRGSA